MLMYENYMRLESVGVIITFLIKNMYRNAFANVLRYFGKIFAPTSTKKYFRGAVLRQLTDSDEKSEMIELGVVKTEGKKDHPNTTKLFPKLRMHGQ